MDYLNELSDVNDVFTVEAFNDCKWMLEVLAAGVFAGRFCKMMGLGEYFAVVFSGEEAVVRVLE